MTNVYPVPPYMGAVQDIMSTIEISRYHYYELVNSFKAGTFVNFNNGEPDPDIQRRIESDLQEMLTPTENAGGLFISYNDSPEQAPDIKHMMGNDLPDRYNLTEAEVKKNIFQAIRRGNV